MHSYFSYLKLYTVHTILLKRAQQFKVSSRVYCLLQLLYTVRLLKISSRTVV